MTLVKVNRRPGFPFQGQYLEAGAEVDTRTWPHLPPDKWATMLGTGWFVLVDPPGGDLKRAIAHRNRAQSETANESVVEMTPLGAVDVPLVDPPIVVKTATACPDCGHPVKSEHGLKVHRGRKHKE